MVHSLPVFAGGADVRPPLWQVSDDQPNYSVPSRRTIASIQSPTTKKPKKNNTKGKHQKFLVSHESVSLPFLCRLLQPLENTADEFVFQQVTGPLQFRGLPISQVKSLNIWRYTTVPTRRQWASRCLQARHEKRLTT